MQKASCAIMFADISGSTQMYDQLGDEAAKRTIDKCLGQLQIVTEAHKGVVIKKIGDELMCRFDSADAAVSAARVSQSEIKALGTLENTLLAIRAGIHYGEVIEDDNDIFGDAVNIAARMAGIAKGGQIITTADTVSELNPELGSQARQVDLTRVKGKQEKLAVFEVLWEQSGDVTRVATELL
ncbi:MAG: adenylate/guanylate cyclase domain-containing protein, partial [Gammaproteobacteria bacterium]|nr:adenylate/guanylate cyclase domain-containing protein [Gammaproteobacteria bacterium]